MSGLLSPGDTGDAVSLFLDISYNISLSETDIATRPTGKQFYWARYNDDGDVILLKELTFDYLNQLDLAAGYITSIKKKMSLIYCSEL